MLSVAKDKEYPLAKRVRELRTLTGLSQKELGALVKLSGAAIGLIENGERKNPHVNTLKGIAGALGTTVDYLLTGEGAQPTAASIRRALGGRDEDAGFRSDHVA